MPRDDLSIDFVKKMAPPVEAQDPGLVLDDWINRVQNLPEEIRFLQDEIADKDRDFHDIVKSASENDEKMQRHYRQHGNATPFPRENQTREIIRQAYIRADKIAVEKITLSQKMQSLYDKHLRYLDAQLKQLGDRAEPGFTDPDEIPSLLRPSAANNSNTSIRVLAAAAGAASAQASKPPLTPITTNTPAAGRAANAQSRAAQSSVNGSSSVPTTPVGNILINRNQRESSAGPGGTAPKRGPRASSNLGNVATASSGLGRQSSLGPGTPKAGTPGANSRAGSAGPRTNNKNPGASRKGTPTGGVARKKAQPKSTLSRVKRAGNTKGSPSSNADSELSDADSVPSSRGGRGSRAGSGTPVPSASTNKNHNSTAPASAATPSGTASGPATGQEPTADADEDMPDAPEEEEDEEGSISVASEPEDDEEEDEEGKKYCFCQHVSYGDMVACDNDSCPYEWFHWNCVGLKSTPEGTWYCPSCEENRGKKDSGNKEGAGSVPTGNKKNK